MAPTPSIIAMSEAMEFSAADMQTELSHLRQRNKELQFQLDEAAKTNRRDSGAISPDKDGKEQSESSSSSLESGVELTKRTQVKELIGSKSISLNGNSPDGLHHRRSSAGKEINGDAAQHTRSVPFVNLFKRRGVASPNASNVDRAHATKNYEHLSSSACSRSSEESVSDTECNNHQFSRTEGKKNSSNGVGECPLYKPPLPIVVHSDEEEGPLQDVHIQTTSNNKDEEEIDGLMDGDDDSSHNKHLPKLPKVLPAHSPHSASSSAFPPFKDQVKERASWLIGLLFFQSCSSFIIQYNQEFLQDHMVIVQFLTMLVGAGGNAGNQASVRVIRSLAVGTLNRHTMKLFLRQEAKMALCLSALIGTTGFIRAALFRTPPGETIAITASVFAIVAISIAIGSTLPLGMKKVGIDPANSSTSIQVIMDILGVLITVCVSSFVLSFKIWQSDDAGGG